MVCVEITGVRKVKQTKVQPNTGRTIHISQLISAFAQVDLRLSGNQELESRLENKVLRL